MSDRPVLEVENLHVRFAAGGGVIHAVNGISFCVEPGEVLGLIGESGSGKSVTLRALMGLLPGHCHVEGRITVCGEPVNGTSDEKLRALRGARIGMIFQEPKAALDPLFTIGVQIEETILRHEAVNRRDARRRALDLLEMVQIPSAKHRLHAFPHELSGGMRQRAMIALALCCRPSLLLADEPTTALDVSVQIQILLLLRQLQTELGMAVVFVTHDVGAAAEISDRLAVMYAGRFVELGSTRDVLGESAHPYTRSLLSVNLHNADPELPLYTIPGAPPNLTAPPVGCAFAPRCSEVLDACRAVTPSERPLGKQHSASCLRLL
jgi:peptide/nickel transport system ATP-binding protein